MFFIVNSTQKLKEKASYLTTLLSRLSLFLSANSPLASSSGKTGLILTATLIFEA